MLNFVSRHEAIHVLDQVLQESMPGDVSSKSYTQASSTFAPDAGHVPTLSVRVDSLVPQPPVARYDAVLVDSFGLQGARLAETVQYANREDLDDAERACNSGDFDRLRELAHRVKGAALVIGATPLADACRALQDACSSDSEDAHLYDLTRVHFAYQHFHDEILNLDAALDIHFSRQRAVLTD